MGNFLSLIFLDDSYSLKFSGAKKRANIGFLGFPFPIRNYYTHFQGFPLIQLVFREERDDAFS